MPCCVLKYLQILQHVPENKVCLLDDKFTSALTAKEHVKLQTCFFILCMLRCVLQNASALEVTCSINIGYKRSQAVYVCM